MKLLELTTLVLTGFISCAEFGSYAFVHPALRRLPLAERITVEKGLLKTFGRVMPVGMTLCVVLAITTAVDSGGVGPLSWAVAAAFAVAVVSTVVVNVPINRATDRLDEAPGGHAGRPCEGPVAGHATQALPAARGPTWSPRTTPASTRQGTERRTTGRRPTSLGVAATMELCPSPPRPPPPWERCRRTVRASTSSPRTTASSR